MTRWILVLGCVAFVAGDAGAAQTIRKIANDGTIARFAGTGTAGYSGDGADALSAQLNSPYEISYPDGACWFGDHVYIADTGNNVIRRLVLSTNVISTFAGTGVAGYSGGGGPATSARLNAPRGVVGHTEGGPNEYVYVADTGNHMIRRVAPDGTIMRVAGTGTPGYSGDGGNPLSAQLNGPTSLAYATYPGDCWSGNGDVLYVADTGNNAIRKIIFLSTGNTIQTVAGTGVAGNSGDGGPGNLARLNAPRGIGRYPESWGDPYSYLYIADTGNHVIRRLASDGTIIRVAGTGTAGYSGDGENPLTAQLNNPYALALVPDNVDPSSGPWRMFVADAGNNVIRKVTLVSTGGMITTVAGTGTVGAGGDGGAAISAQFNSPRGIAATLSMPNTSIYVVDTGTNLDPAPVIPGKDQSVILAPTVLDRAKGGVIHVVVKGEAGAAVELMVYDATGEYIGSWHPTLDGSGRAEILYRGEEVGGHKLGSGVFWVVPKGGGVTGKRAFVISGKR